MSLIQHFDGDDWFTSLLAYNIDQLLLRLVCIDQVNGRVLVAHPSLESHETSTPHRAKTISNHSCEWYSYLS